MTTTDSNGITRYQASDPVSPLHTLLNVGMQSVSDAITVALTPPGTVSMFAGATAPAGWLVCNGTSVSRTAQAKLFAAIGTTYGVGDGSTTFNLPNLVGRVPIGQGGDYPTMGATGGAATSSHGLSASRAQAQITFSATGQASMNRVSGPFTASVQSGTITGGAVSNSTASLATSVGLQGNTDVSNNMQPYVVMKYIIRT